MSKKRSNWKRISTDIFRLYKFFDIKRKAELYFLICLTILSAVSELISLGSIFPFLHALTNQESLNDTESVAFKFLDFLGLSSYENKMLILGFIFAAAALFSGFVRSFAVWFAARLSFRVGIDINFNLVRNYLNDDYLIHIGRNTNEFINTVTRKVDIAIQNTLFPVFLLFSSLIILVAISFMLLYLDSAASLIAAGGFIGIYFLILVFTSPQKKFNSKQIAHNSTGVLKHLREAFASFKDIKINSFEDLYLKKYISFDKNLKKAQASNIFLQQSPRFGMEAFGLSLIIFLSLYLVSNSPYLNVIPTLGVLALGAQRTLPVLNTLYVSLSLIEAGQDSLRDLLKENLSKSNFKENLVEDIEFKRNLKLEIDSFSYSNREEIFNSTDLEISIGDVVGIVGATGIGKSTLVDILMGLIDSDQIKHIVDENILEKNLLKSWRKKISHVPQEIFLIDGSIKENIILNSDDQPNEDLINKSLKMSDMDNFIRHLENGIDTSVGERGINLSGGQRQRIAIARALYTEKEILVLDEATSALDTETESNVISNIKRHTNYKVIVMIAHRKSSLKNCNKIFEISNKKIITKSMPNE